MKILKIDEKWSIEYDPENNCRPEYWLRHGERCGVVSLNNPEYAMFYALLAVEESERTFYD